MLLFETGQTFLVIIINFDALLRPIYTNRIVFWWKKRTSIYFHNSNFPIFSTNRYWFIIKTFYILPTCKSSGFLNPINPIFIDWNSFSIKIKAF